MLQIHYENIIFELVIPPMSNRKQQIPDIAFDNFALGEINNLFADEKVHLNEEYQRGDFWKTSQQVELIKSIFNSYSIGVLVLYINDKGQYEILDGQQRLLTLNKYINDKIPLKGTDVIKYSELSARDRMHLNAYSVYYLKLKSHNTETKEEDIVQTFLRLQEGTPLNKAEKLNAYRGQFKDEFVKIKKTHPIFELLGDDKRFRLRQLAAEMLLLELESDFKNTIFPSLDISTFKKAIQKYSTDISKTKITFFKGNLDYIHNSLNILLTAITPRELIPIYLLVSYLRKQKADNANLRDELSIFIEDFLKDLNSFSVYDVKAPQGMPSALFKKYQKYKSEARKATSSDSIKYRFDFFLERYNERFPIIFKDSKRLHDKEQKRILYLRQRGICPECNKIIDFRIDGSAHHIVAYKDGGQTDDLSNAVLLHERCHVNLEKKLIKNKH